jgi:VIT1/CCC1 family predicted Fe2+/Mn2+ transporter
LDGPLPKWCPAVALSRQDGRHSAVALLLKAALIQVNDYRLLGASGLSVLRFTAFDFTFGIYSNFS